ncbi:MAG: 1-acyl-sn-glycerol-3-phosphate acyltransferase [Gammaproteobacteria bacterium]|nr:1-acyl-sn-glycerol-3-phosphate acyltransferase [Gammaproteobacteria bacterium]
MKILLRLLMFVPSVVYFFWLITVSSVVSTIYILAFMIPYKQRYLIARLWGYLSVLGLKLCCFLRCQIIGRENIPTRPFIVFSKHQSSFEILVLMSTLGPTSWVAKREILRLPIFGWAFGMSKPICLDRKAGITAVEQLNQQGQQALDEGRNVLIFPEGTRKAPGTKPHYRIGGALLAEKTGYPILPVAHNCGEFWPRLSFFKWPGKATLIFGPLLETKGKKASEINQQAQEWIEGRMEEISNPSRWNR